MFQWRVTKYNPTHRNGEGAYQLVDWTAASDIGTMFSGSVLEAREYLEVEDAYVSTVSDFMRDAGLQSLEIEEIERLDDDQASLTRLGLEPIPFAAETLLPDQKLDMEEVASITRLALRALLWCKLRGAGGFYVHFGHDFYMYIGSPLPSHEARAAAAQRGLFVERKRSPYAG